MNHTELIESLAEHLDTDKVMVFTELPLGSVSMGQRDRVDVMTLRKSFTQPLPTIYEVKAHRGDFTGDVARDKWAKYLPYCRRLYFAAPAKVIAKADVPEECGLIVLGPNGWHVVKGARSRACTLDIDVLVKCLIRQSERRVERSRRAELKEAVERNGLHAWSCQFSKRVHDRLAKADYYEAQLAKVTAGRDEIVAEIAEELGLEYRGESHGLVRAIRQMQETHANLPKVTAAMTVARAVLNSAGAHGLHRSEVSDALMTLGALSGYALKNELAEYREKHAAAEAAIEHEGVDDAEDGSNGGRNEGEGADRSIASPV